MYYYCSESKNQIGINVENFTEVREIDRRELEFGNSPNRLRINLFNL